ncbi:MAG TPA: adenosylcobinamide-GDP ribazoletransferase [Desulfobacterales bacterium]|nr:adenosylcobinamide-GDP ribazoletransferase [Desulfobacterales bacterium]
MKNLLSAIQFLTILPVGKLEEYGPRGIAPFFPIVGILLGVMVAAFDAAVSHFWPLPVVSLLDVVFLVVITGALHLDGLGDAADGLLGHRPVDRVLAIMKDSRIGVMGLIAIICVLSIKWGGIMSLTDNRSLLLMIIPAYARGSMIFGTRFLRYGRPDKGLGRPLFENRLKVSAFLGLLIPVGLSFFLGSSGIWLNLIFIILTAAILLYYHWRVECITGDMLGAMTEVMESMLFLLISVV